MRQALAAVSAVLAVAVLVAAPAWTPEVGMRALSGLCAAVAVVLACTGLGGALLRDSDAVEALALGLGVVGLALLPLGALGLLSPWSCAAVVCLAAAGWLRRPQVSLPAVPLAAVLLAAPFLLVGLVAALTPAWDTDEVYQHLALPSKFLLEGGLVGGFLHPDGSRPMGLHLGYTAALALGGEVAPKLLALTLAAGLLAKVATVEDRVAGLAGVALLLGSYTVVRELGLVYNNLPTALYGLLALSAAQRSQGGRLALFAGLGLAAKYTLAPVVVGVYLLYWSRVGWRSLKPVALATAGALALVAPWWVRNLLEGLHPLFPYAGWPSGEDFHFVFLERYGMGRGVVDFLLLPWNATVHGDPESYVFLGRVTPAGLVLLPAAVVAWLRGERWIGVAALGFVGWSAGPHWLRYLLMAAPVLAMAGGVAFSRLPGWGRAAVAVVWLAGLPSNLGPWLDKQAPSVALGQDPAEPLLEERLPGWTCAAWVNENAPEDAVVALLFAWPGAALERRWVLSSVEDHVPTRHWLHVHGQDSLRDLKAVGVTHVLAGRPRFLYKLFSFLSQPEFQAQFKAPEEQLSELLLAQGTLVFEDGRYGVWRLN